jgi:hypothetical protein
MENNPFEDSALTTILVVSDMERSKAFYVDVLRHGVFSGIRICTCSRSANTGKHRPDYYKKLL